MGQTGERTVMFSVPGQRAVLVCVLGRFSGKSFELSAGTFTIGRSPDCTLCLADDSGASRVHTKIWLEGDDWFVADNDSRNGTFVNKKAVRQSRLQNGDVVRVSTCELRFSVDGADMQNAEPAQKAKNEFSKTTLQRAMAPNAMTASMPAARVDANGNIIRPAATPGTAGPRGAVKETSAQRAAPPPPPALVQPDPTPSSSPSPAAPPPPPVAPKPPASPAVIIGMITGGMVLAGLLVVGAAVAWKKTQKPGTPTPVLVAQAPPTPTPPPVSVSPPNTPVEVRPDPPPPPPVPPPVSPPDRDPDVVRDPPPRNDPPPKNDPPPVRVRRDPPPKQPDPPPPPPPPPPSTNFNNAEWIPATVDTGAVDVVRSKSKGTIASVNFKDGDTVSAGQVVISFAGGVDGPANVAASAAGKLDGLRIKSGDAVQKGVMLFKLIDAGTGKKVRAVLPPAVLPKAKVGGNVELKKRKGGTAQGRIVRLSGAAIVVDPGDTNADTVESVRIP